MPNNPEAYVDEPSVPGFEGLEAGGLDVQIPTTRLVSRPASPTPSLPSQVDTDSTPSENSDPENDSELAPRTDEGTAVQVDLELEARRAEEKARRAEQQRQREEARKLEEAKEAHQCWNFQLPQLRARRLPQLNDPDVEWYFDIRLLTAAVQKGEEKEDKVRDYLQRCSKIPGFVNMNETVEGFPVMFYAAETNNEKMVQLFTQYGGDVNCFARYQSCHEIPLLGFAIINALRLEQPTSAMIATLLSLGASAEVIPRAFYDPFTTDLPGNGPLKDTLTDLNDPQRSWCESKWSRKALARALDLTQRYYLHKSTMIPKPRKRHRQVTKLQRAEPLWEVPYLLIGQIPAATMVTERIVTNLVIQSRKPMVLVFAGISSLTFSRSCAHLPTLGPSGHGKTELARKLEYLLSLQMQIIDCTTFSSESGLFGPRMGIVGNEKGSTLNNFLASNHGKRAIVFMDEFEKTSHSVHNALLVPFDNGKAHIIFPRYC